LAAAADERVAALRVVGAVEEIEAEEEQGSATVDFAAARAAAVREAAAEEPAADLPTAGRRVAAIVLPFNPFQGPANRARATRAVVDRVLANQRQAREIRIRVGRILHDPERRDLIVLELANQVIDRVIAPATAIGLVTDRGTVPETAIDRASLEKETALAIGQAMATGPAIGQAMETAPALSRVMVTVPAPSRAVMIGPATGRAVMIGPATGRVMAIGPATGRATVIDPAIGRAMATALGIDPATVRGFTRRLTAIDL
jgi:hypothetical protein